MSFVAQIDLGSAARALDQHQIGLGLQACETVEDRRQQPRLHRLEIPRRRVADGLAQHDDLRADIALRLQQHRVHVHRGGDPAGPRLQRLRPADLAAVGGHRGIVRHVLRLERPHLQAAIA